jgi:hypothetical protein
MAGYRMTTSANLIIDNQDRGSAASEYLESLIVGHFSPVVSAQWVNINGVLIVGNATTKQILNVYGGNIRSIKQITANYNVELTDSSMMLHPQAQAVTATLPSNPTTGTTFKFKATHDAFTATINGNGANIDNSGAKILSLYEAVVLQYDGNQWWILN